MRAPRPIVVLVVATLAAAFTWWTQCTEDPRPSPSETLQESDEANGARRGTNERPADQQARSASDSRSSGSAEDPAETIRPGSLSVSVRLEDGRPGAPLPVTVTGLQGRADGNHTQTMVTSDQGVASFENLTPGPWRVTLGREAEERVVIRSGEESELQLTIARGRTVLVRVVDSSGARCSDARVLLWTGAPFSDAPSWAPGIEVGRTNPRGELLLTGVPNLDQNGSWLAAEHDRLGASKAEEVPAPDPEEPSDGARYEVVLRLESLGVGVRCHVVDDADQPVPDALVDLDPVDEPSPTDVEGRGDLTAFITRAARTNEFGEASLAPFPSGTWDLRVRHKKYALHRQRLQIGERPLQLTISLQRPAEFSVRCLDEERAPIPGARVGIKIAGQRFRGVSGAGGVVEFTGLPEGPCEFSAYDDSYAPASGETTLTRGERTEAELALPDLGVLRGTAQDELGAPLSGWRLVVRGKLPTFGTDMRTMLIESEGEFSIPVRKDLGYQLELREPDTETRIRLEDLGEVTAAGPPLALVVRRDQLATAFVSGRLVDDQGDAALTEVVITASAHGRLLYSRSTMKVDEWDEATGRFRIGPLRPGSYTVGFLRPDRFRFEQTDVVLTPDQTTVLGELTWPASGKLELSVEPLPGAPLRDVMAQLKSSTSSYFVPIDTETRLGTATLAPGEYDVTVYGGGFYATDTTTRVEVGHTTKHAVVLQPAIRVPFRVHMPEGETGLTVQILDAARRLVFDFELDARQPFDEWAPHLPEGRFFVEAAGSDGTRYSTQFEVETLEGTPVRRDLHLQRR